MANATELRLPALEIRQGPSRVFYSFAVDGKLLSSFVTISRIHRDSEHGIQGYQRPEVLRHIAEIRAYLESDRPMIPNAIVVAFDGRVRFEPSEVQPLGTGYSRVGTFVIPWDKSLPDEAKPGWIVDGQQRSAAIRDADIDRFPVCVTAFIAESEQEQKEQFILVNSTKPLPKGLIYELLPGTESRLPASLQKRRFPAFLAERLNFDLDSPFRGLIQMPTTPDGIIKDNSILKMLENSLGEGVLHTFRNGRTGKGDHERMLQVVKSFWGAIRRLFPEAWGVPPRHSRLMHGVGIVGTGFLMDAMMDAHLEIKETTVDEIVEELRPLVEVCRWTSGVWDFGPGTQRRWNELQNTSKDITLLADHLLRQYRLRVWEPAHPRRRANGGR